MISIIVPVYNTKKFLGHCINSVKTQRFREWECIIVNDCSTDGSDKKIAELVSWDNRFTVIHHSENKGLPAARNTGIAAAKGDAIFFLDSDDWLERDALSDLNGYSEENPDVGRIVGLDMVHWVDKEFVTPWSISPSGLHSPDSCHLFSGNDCDVGHCTGCLYVRRNIPCRLSFPRVKIFEDMIFNMGLIFAGVSTYISTRYTYHYRRYEGTLVSAPVSIEEAGVMRKELANLASRFNAKPEVYERCSAFLERALQGKLNGNTL